MQSIMIMIESNDITSSKQALLSLHGTDPEYCTQNARFVLEGLLTVPHLHETQFLHADPLVCQESRNLLYIDASQQRQQLLRLQVSTTHYSTVLPWRNMGVHRLGKRGVGPANRNSIGRRFGMGSSDIRAAAPLAVKCGHGFSFPLQVTGRPAASGVMSTTSNGLALPVETDSGVDAKGRVRVDWTGWGNIQETAHRLGDP
jgi:hypothetical protein